MGKTKAQASRANKVQRIAKQALLSPYFAYFETMPSKQSKEFINVSLPKVLTSMNLYLNQVASEVDHEPVAKR